jgi:hypothetical protein
MTTTKAVAFFLTAVVSGSLVAQSADPNLRTLSTEGITFKKPVAWDWQSEIAANIALKKDITVKDRTYTITAEMVFSAEGFVEETIAGIEKKVKASKGDLRDLKKTRGEKFAGASATLVSYTRVRGEKQDEFEDERQYLFRRNGSLYTWTERAHRNVASQAGLAFSAARSAITWTTKDTAREPKVWADAGVKFVLPADYEFEKVNLTLPKGNENELLLHIGTLISGKTEQFYVQCVLTAQKSPNSLDDVEKQGKTIFEKNFEDIQDFQIIDKQQLRGEKALLMSFTGIPTGAKDDGDQKRPRQKNHFWWIKRKGYVMTWRELIPLTPSPALDAALKKGRDGITWL